jgi:ABC-type uncharacterized transport system substrate-binding protein
MRWAILSFCAGMTTAGYAAAHPHMFIDAGVTIRFDAEGRATGVQIEWRYDGFFSLSYLTDEGYDPDFDGVLTPDEEARLTGFDTRWEAGHAGDSYAFLGDAPLAMSGPSGATARVVDGQIVTSHFRSFAEAVTIADAPLVVQVYDPSFFTAYTLTPDPVLTDAPADCLAQVFRPDRSKADDILLAALAKLPPTADAEAEFPAVGAVFAEEARVICGLG